MIIIMQSGIVFQFRNHRPDSNQNLLRMQVMLGVLIFAFFSFYVIEITATFGKFGSYKKPDPLLSFKRTDSLLDANKYVIERRSCHSVSIMRRKLMLVNIMNDLRGGSSICPSNQSTDFPLPSCRSDENNQHSVFAVKEKLGFVLPDGRKRYLTITNETRIVEMLRTVSRAVSQTPMKDMDGHNNWIMKISSNSFRWKILNDLQNSSVYSLLSTCHQNISRNDDGSISISVESEIDSGISPNVIRTSLPNNQLFHIKRQKPLKSFPIQISKEITPILQEIRQFGGVAVVGGVISDTTIHNSSTKFNAEKRKEKRKVITMQVLRKETIFPDDKKTISITAALHVSHNANFVLNENSSSQILQAQKLLTEGGLQVIGIIIGHDPTLSPKTWNPVSCWSLMKVSNLLQNNQTILLSVYDPENVAEQQAPSGSSQSQKKKRRSLAITNGQFGLEAFQLSKQAWQLFNNNSIVQPVLPAMGSPRRRKLSKDSNSKITNDHLQLLYPARAGNLFDVNRVDVDFFAVPVPLELSSKKHHHPLSHIFPSPSSLEKEETLRKQATKFVEKLFRKIAKSNRIDDDSWLRLRDVHLWHYLAAQKYLSPKSIQNLLQDLQSSSSNHVLSPSVKMEIDMLVNLWDSENIDNFD